jgi:hypothetical protein
MYALSNEQLNFIALTEHHIPDRYTTGISSQYLYYNTNSSSQANVTRWKGRAVYSRPRLPKSAGLQLRHYT